MKLRVLGHNVLVQAIPQPTKVNGIHLVERYQDNRVYYIVRQVGPKVKEIQAGDRVIAHSFQGDRFHFPDGTKLILDSEIIAVQPKA
ncbi:MAG TPA: hypothetical protein VF077_13135 [Nitrospiraceae bacterium]